MATPAIRAGGICSAGRGGKVGSQRARTEINGDGGVNGRKLNATDEDELRQVLASMPLHEWMTVTVTPFTPHPSDPGIGRPAG